MLLRQLVDAEGPRELVGLLGIGGDGGNNGGDRDCVLALLEITRSLGSAPYGTRLAARRGRHSSAAAAARPVGAVERAVATVAVTVRKDADCCEAMPRAQATPGMWH